MPHSERPKAPRLPPPHCAREQFQSIKLLKGQQAGRNRGHCFFLSAKFSVNADRSRVERDPRSHTPAGKSIEPDRPACERFFFCHLRDCSSVTRARPLRDQSSVLRCAAGWKERFDPLTDPPGNGRLFRKTAPSKSSPASSAPCLFRTVGCLPSECRKLCFRSGVCFLFSGLAMRDADGENSLFPGHRTPSGLLLALLAAAESRPLTY